MTDKDIQEAARLISEIKELEALKLSSKERYALARPYHLRGYGNHVIVGGGNWDSLVELTPALAAELVQSMVAKKKARLNDLRAGC